MNSQEIENIIIRFLNNTASKSELDTLNLWLSKEENQKKFNDYVELEYVVKSSFANTKPNKTIAVLKQKIKKTKNQKLMLSFTKYAAAIIVFISIGLWYSNFEEKQKNHIEIPNDKISIAYNNDITKSIKETDNTTLKNNSGKIVFQQNGNLLSFKNTEETKGFNTVNVPFGKTINILLPDGSTVYLNAGSSLTFPKSFKNLATREVKLTGEGYFEVTKDKKHPFIVTTESLNIEVLGTEFNISAYDNDDFMQTVLVEGSVALYDNNKKNQNILAPNQSASWNKKINKINIQTVNTEHYIAWKNGKLVFKNTEFKEILKRLERHYNVDIICKNSILNNQYYDASFDTENIQEVLEAFNKSYAIDYTIENNKIIIL